MLVSCTPVLKKGIMNEGTVISGMSGIKEDPESNKGRLFIFGGVIVKTTVTNEGSLIEAIRSEAEVLEPLRELADHVVDTSAMSLRDLREEVIRICRKSRVAERLSITLLTFGYKYGLPFDTDLVFDVRFLPNPFFVKELKHQTGLDDPALPSR